MKEMNMDLPYDKELCEMYGVEVPESFDSEDAYAEYARELEKARGKAEIIGNAQKVISREVNHMGNEKQLVKTFLWFLTHDHRTLQQSFWKFIFSLMEEYSKLDPKVYMDLRNEAAQEACTKVSEFLKKEGVYLPLI
jgi:hypothetical protein